MDYLIFLNGFSWIMLFIFGSTFCIHQIIETSKPGTIFELQALASEVEDFSTYEACQGTMFVVFRKAKWGFRVLYGLYMGYISYIYMGFSWADQHDKTKGRRNWLLASNGVLFSLGWWWQPWYGVGIYLSQKLGTHSPIILFCVSPCTIDLPARL